MEIDKELKEYLESEGYSQLKIVEGRGICGIRKFMFTTAIVEGLTKDGYTGRWCYPHDKVVDLAIAYVTWDGVGDPSGDWVKYKGRVEYSNPNL